MIVSLNDAKLPDIIADAARACAKCEGIAEFAMGVKLVNDIEIRALNFAARGVDAPTDVLSFPAINYPLGKTARDCPKRVRREYDPALDMAYLGDCVISLERARAQALEYGHSLERELGYLAAHSACHLMGYDHMKAEDKARMRSIEKRAMDELKLWRIDEMTDEKLFALACEAREMAYTPYSNFKVGACLLAEDGRVFKGCNFENASFGATICAERCAVGAAIVAGARKFTAIAVAGTDSAAWPCGVCRQVLNEFSADMRVICGPANGEFEVVKLSELLPKSFGPEYLNLEDK